MRLTVVAGLIWGLYFIWSAIEGSTPGLIVPAVTTAMAFGLDLILRRGRRRW